MSWVLGSEGISEADGQRKSLAGQNHWTGEPQQPQAYYQTRNLKCRVHWREWLRACRDSGSNCFGQVCLVVDFVLKLLYYRFATHRSAKKLVEAIFGVDYDAVLPIGLTRLLEPGVVGFG